MDFQRSLDEIRIGLQWRPTPIHNLKNTSNQIELAQISVKREDLDNTGGHEINHCVGFVLLVREMGKTKLIVETWAGQHGVALPTAATYYDLECEVLMGAAVEIDKHNFNVARMLLLGANVVSAFDG